MTTPYRLYYWPFIPGRGEPLRLIMEVGGVAYVDVGRLPEPEGGVAAIKALMVGDAPVYAPPILEIDGVFHSQMPNLAAFLAQRSGLCPADDPGRMRANQVMLTICDVMSEAHDTHHPISTALYYEEQLEASKLAAEHFRKSRIPAFLRHFEKLAVVGNAHLVGGELSYCDLAMFNLLEGLEYAFPRWFALHGAEYPALDVLRQNVAALPAVEAYRASDRWIGFNEHGLFRRYPELDEPE